MEDQELIKAIEAYKRGEDVDENFNIIYHRSHSFVENKIRSYVSERKTASYDIEDITQDVYIQMSRNFNLEEPKAFWSWATKIAKGKTEDFFDSRQGHTILRENANSSHSEDDDDEDQISSRLIDYSVRSNPEFQIDQDNTVEAVVEILNSLTDAQREVIILTYQHGLKGQEAADALGINLNTLKSRQKSARDAIYKKKSELQKRGVEIAVIPFVLLLHIACRSDETLAATLASEVATASVANLSSGTASAAQSASAASHSTAGSAGSVANAASASGAGKAAVAGIGVKAAAATVAAVAIVGGGVMAYKSIRPAENAVQETAVTVTAPIVTTTEATETSTEVAEELSVYASIYAPAAEDFAERHNVPFDDVLINLGDIDGDGMLEAFMSDNDGEFEALYITSGTTAVLVGESYYGDIVYRTADGGAYVLLYGGEDLESDSIYFISGGSSNFVMYRDQDHERAKQLVSDWSGSRDSNASDLPHIIGEEFSTLTESALADALANNFIEHSHRN